MFFTSSRAKVRGRKPRSTSIRLEVLEDRLPPGDILFGLAFSSVWLRPGNVFGNQPTALLQESAVACNRDLSVLLALDETSPSRTRHVTRLADAGSASSHVSQGGPPLAIGGFELPGVETRRRLPSAKEEGILTTRRQGLEIGMPWANHGTTAGGPLVVDLPALPAGASLPGKEMNEPSPLAFDRAGVLHIRAEGADQTISETVTPAGFVQVTIAGQRHSADPASDSFDPALAGATSSTLAGLWLESGGAGETLILGAQQLAGGLLVHAGDAQVVTQDVRVGGPVAIQASAVIVSGALDSSGVTLAASGLVSIEASARVTAEQIAVAADIFVNAGQIHADGPIGGRMEVQSRNVLNAGPITADGISGDGGQVGIIFTGSYVGTVAGLTSAHGSQGGSVRIDGGSTGRLYSSGSHLVTGRRGGQVDLLGREVVLPGATVDASGQSAGGTVRIGGDFHGRNPDVVNAQTVIVTGATTIRANATGSGSGGRVAIWSDGETDFSGSIAAHGGSTNGDGGFIEVSGKGNLKYGGSADAGTHLGRAGSLLLDPKNLVIDASAGVLPQFNLIDPHPTVGGRFGYLVTVLSNGNVIVTNPNDDFGGINAGAVYLFNGLTGALLSSLVGSNPGDFVGAYHFSDYYGDHMGPLVTLLSNGNYEVISPSWNGNRGAVTWGSGTKGVSGTVSGANSLVGSNPGDGVGGSYSYHDDLCPDEEGHYIIPCRLGDIVGRVTFLSNGNYLVRSPNWNGNRGAVTWGSGTKGVSGAVSDANSLVGSNPNDRVGSDQSGNLLITFLSNGNYVVRSPFWNSQRGAVTWGSGTTGVSGTVSDNNSLVGSNPGDRVGYGRNGFDGVSALSNGNYVVSSPTWNNNQGAATWGNGSTGASGTISDANSLVGSNLNDQVGLGITPLSNGNYVVASPFWNGSRGAATWGDGSTGVSGTISDTNSLIGNNPNDGVGNPLGLSNGNYVVRSSAWNGGRGAVTWGSGSMGVSGTVSDANSLVGSNPNDHVGSGDVWFLGNGNYLVRSPNWNGNRGAVTWGSGSMGVSGTVSDANSLVGSNANDWVGDPDSFYLRGITFLSNGNYLVLSPRWNGYRGAVTWGSGSAGVSGAVSDANSVVGSNANDRVGDSGRFDMPGTTLLSSGNYLVLSPSWNGNRGAVTWGDSSTGASGAVSAANSLVGSNANDRVGDSGNFYVPSIVLLSNGNYLVRSRLNDNRGAVTWGSGSTGVSGTVSDANSLVGSNPNDQLGGGGITLLSNGNYVVGSAYGGRGAVTWGSGTAGVSGIVSEANSLVASNPGDQVGVLGVIPLNNGNYVVGSNWNGQRGAVTWGNGSTGVSGTISATNSLVGSSPGDGVGIFVRPFSNGNYVVRGPYWNGGRGAVTWGNGTTGVSGTISAANSLVGSNPNDGVGNIDVTLLSNGNYVVSSMHWNGNRGAATWANGSTGVSGTISDANSLVGSNPNDLVGWGVTALSNGNYMVGSQNWSGQRGAVTWGSGSTGISGSVSDANSLVGSNPGDEVGRVELLSNGNYVVRSPYWNGNRGAVTWGSGSTGVSGTVSDTNSLVGSNPNDRVGNSGVTPLSDGNYLIPSPFWNGNRGAVTWVNGTTGQTLDGIDTITPQNSLVGTVANAGLGFVGEDTPLQTFLAAFTTEAVGRIAAGLVDPTRLPYAFAQSQTLTITPDLLTRTLNTGTAVVLQASNDITLNSPITVSASGQGGALTLQAGRSILLNASITTDNGALTLIANDQLVNGVVDAERDAGNAVITVADGTTLNTGSGSLMIELRDGAGRTNRDSGAITLQTITAGSLSVANNGPSAGSDVIVGPVATSGAQSYANPNGTATVTGNLTTTDSPITFNQAVALNAGLTLSVGSSTVSFAGGTVAPDPGLLTVAGGVALTGASTYSAVLNGAEPGSYSQVTASGPINLGGNTLSLLLGFDPPLGSTFTLLSTDTGPILGTFAGLDEGATFTQGGFMFQITYQGGPDGNSVVLTRVG
jgi:hypothetical protein